jgi:hypothetical protein
MKRRRKRGEKKVGGGIQTKQNNFLSSALFFFLLPISLKINNKRDWDNRFRRRKKVVGREGEGGKKREG